MSTQSASRTSNLPPAMPKAAPLLQAVVALAAGLVLFIILLGGFTVAFDMYHSGKIFPGISIAGIDLSSMSPDQASALITQSAISACTRNW